MDLALNNLQRLICYKTKPNQTKIRKETTVILILKPFKDHTNAKNYRPITLSSCVCKTLERMINAILICYLETNRLITEY